MKIVVITNSSSYELRAEKIADLLIKMGHQVILIESDFIHREKIKGRQKKIDHIFIDTIPYSKNISIKRLYSHYDFSRKTYKALEGMEADVLYVLIPANSLTKFAALYKARFKVKLVFDIIDLWPESLPMKKIKEMWPISLWGEMRNKNLPKADLVITECSLYQKILSNYLGCVNTRTIYWPKDRDDCQSEYYEDKNCIHICYLGSINNIIDIDFIVSFMIDIKLLKSVCLHVIGDGECRELFLEKLTRHNIYFIYHGVIYDAEKKREVFSKCRFGLNIMKDSVCVGITMKSVDYLCAGIPLINNIKGDTWELIEKYQIGFNCDSQNIKSVVKDIVLDDQDNNEIRGRVRDVFEKFFSEQAFEREVKKSLLPLLKEESL